MTFVRYVLVQLVAYAIDLAAYVALVHLGVLPVAANLAGKVPAGAFAFLAHRRYTFRVADRTGARAQALRYVVLLALNAPLSSLLLAGLLMMTTNVTVAKIGADVIAVGLTFIATRTVVFGQPSVSRARDDAR